MEYTIEHKITTLAVNAVQDGGKDSHHTFDIENITFEHWDFNIKDGWFGDAWVAKSKVENTNLISAINTFQKTLRKLYPK